MKQTPKIKKSIQDIVEAELRNAKKFIEGDIALFRYQNNFYYNLPSDVWHGNARYEDMFMQQGVMDTKFADIIGPLTSKEKKLYGNLKYQQTPRQFYATIEMALEDTNTSITEVKTLIRKIVESSDSSKKSLAQIELSKLVQPAYVRLRELGYTYLDLTG